mmetsp:Transcript_43439/g.69512  ORF Transcript_43439/g.69512 Transcript_43439/m.69512 type:complete len:129 (-) Transcript_43439:6-392(-)
MHDSLKTTQNYTFFSYCKVTTFNHLQKKNNTKHGKGGTESTTYINGWKTTDTNNTYDQKPDTTGIINVSENKNDNHMLSSRNEMESTAIMYAMLIFGLSISGVLFLAFITVSIVDNRRKKQLGELNTI